jgi:serine/threonine protein kinase
MTDMTQPPSLASAPLDKGALAGRYRLAGLIGRGGMAEVYRATDTLLRRDVAVKVFHGGSASPDDAVRQQIEVNLLARLTHPGLVALYDAGVDGEDPDTARTYMVLELVEGSTLARRLVQGPVSADDVAVLGAQVADALAYVHRRNIVHRDIKPANILLSVSPDPDTPIAAKLTDFGIARLLDGGQRMTTQGATIGTANYLSPEQAQGVDVTTASDVYSLGLVLIECLTGVRAFPGHGVEAALSRLRRGPLIPSTFGTAWERLLSGMTADDPLARPGADAVARSLRLLSLDARSSPVEDSHTAQIGPLPGLVWSPDSSSRELGTGLRSKRTWLAVTVVLIVIALAGFLGLLLRQTSGNLPATESPATATDSGTPSAAPAQTTPAVPAAGTSPPVTPSSISPVAPKTTPAPTKKGPGNGAGKTKSK